MKVRRAHPHEAGDIAELWLRSRAASVPAIPPPIHSEQDVRTWFERVVLPTKEVWVADTDGAIAALLVLEEEWIDQLYVDPAHTGRGIGTRLLTLAKQQRSGGIKLWTFQANQRARRFYERRGFTAMETTEGDNEEGAPDVRYEWRPSEGAGVRLEVMAYEQTCPRCGREFAGDDADRVADDVIAHARVDHHHALDRHIVLAHLEGVHPNDRDS